MRLRGIIRFNNKNKAARQPPLQREKRGAVRQVQHDSWRNEGAYHFFVVFNTKVVFPNTCACIAQKLTFSETHIIQKQTRLQSKQLKNSHPQKLIPLKTS